MKKLNKDKKKKAAKPSYSPIYQRMYDAIGNEEIFWEWFWERMFASEPEEDFEERVKHLSAAEILLGSFCFSDTPFPMEYWCSLHRALLKEEAK